MEERNRKFILLSTVFLLHFIGFGSTSDCTFGKYDLTDFQNFSPWFVRNDILNATFEVNLCNKLALNTSPGATNCPDGTSVCARFDNGTTVSFGKYSSDPHIDDTNESNNGELVVQLEGETCPQLGSKYISFFFFKCGKTLGHPKSIGEFPCLSHYEWESYVFCNHLPVPENEVPCTTISKDGHHMIDLSPLTKLTGAHLVDYDEKLKSRLYINVCRDITGTANDNYIKKCPNGIGACKVVGDDGKNFGVPSQKLEATDDGARLVYTAKTDTCLTAQTTINFRCPDRGGSKDPVVMTGFLCSIEIDWVTEFACPVNTITSNSCQLTMAEHNVDIDLSPLKHTPFMNPYVVNVTDGSDHYMYYINVCGILGPACGREEAGHSSQTSVCQRKQGSTDSYITGQKGFTTLRYSDDQLTMVMKNGDSCRSNFRRQTTIDFFCNKTAINDGQGQPEYVKHSNCSYFFVWGTKYACLETKMDETCAVAVEGKRFDLSALVKEKGENWEVIAGGNKDGKTYFLNVCHDVLQTGTAAKCPQGSAVCAADGNGGINLGSYKQPLTYDKASGSLMLTYTNGEKTVTNCARITKINFFCMPGNAERAPQLVHRSEDDCYHEIEWHTSAACVLSHKTGSNCKVYDDDAGYTFDLNPLQKSEGYTISADDGNKYVINVCAALDGKDVCQSSPHDNAAICQISSDDQNKQIKIASPSSTLSYFDGVINLAYGKGEADDSGHTLRQAQIAFLCDMNEDKGTPKFLEAKESTYAFEWRTRYACPTLPVECAVIDEKTNKQYDLSSLVKTTDNWEREDRQDPDDVKKFFINVCRPLVPLKDRSFSCSPFASVCAVNIDKEGKEKLYHGNLGRSETSVEVEEFISGIKLSYTNGDTCKDTDGTTKRFKTSIHFDCIHGKTVGGPDTPVLINPCEYSILWTTEAACNVSSVTTYVDKANCTVKDPNSDFLFNLEPLAKKEGYEVKGGSKSYTLNICGALPETTCGKINGKYSSSVCEISADADSKATPLGMLHGSSLDYTSEGEMTLTYKSIFDAATDTENLYVLNFFCDHKAQTPVITFKGKEFKSTVFEVQTALACAPKPVSCMVESLDGKQYDLEPLAKEKDNWIVIDTRDSHKDLRYHINVCRPVNPTTEAACPGGAVAGCQTSKSDPGSNFNMGYVQSEPVLSTTGDAITLRYEGGDKCHVGKPEEAYRSTRIIFLCDKTEKGPVFHTESRTCEYIFLWSTPSACPQQVVTGADCKVTEPLYNYEFDLSSLKKTSGHYTVAGGEHTYLLNVCGNLGGAPEPCADALTGACQTGGSRKSPLVAGHFSNKPQYDSGRITLTYSDGKGNCHGKYNRSAIIDFVCDHDQTGEAGPHYLDEKSDCTYAFEWPTRAACPPHTVVDCTLEFGDKTFDLSRLSRSDGNYETDDTQKKEKYLLNICRSLVHKKGQTCPFDSAACRIDLTEKDPKKRYHNIGEVTSHSISYNADSSTLVMKYGNGELCAGETNKRRSTTILLVCEENSDALGTPNGHFEVNHCEDHFVWSTSAACPLVKQPKVDDKDTDKDLGDCKVFNPNTGYEFDLSILKKAEGYSTYDRNGDEFFLNVCDQLGHSKCADGTGSCQVSRTGDKLSVNTGEANAHLKYDNGVLSLEYRNGEMCSGGKVPRATYINFVCQPGEGNGVPVFIDSSDDCLYYFDWHTQLACETEVECSVHTPTAGYALDFSPLIKKSGQYNVIPRQVNGHQPSGIIFVNLCRPLNPIFGTVCPAGSGACLVDGDKKPVSLGRIDKAPVYDQVHHQTKITYTNGDRCPSNPSVNISTEIILTCGVQEPSKPIEEGRTVDCQYIFLWETPLACEAKKSVQKLAANCSYYDYTRQTNYDLSSLSDVTEVKSSSGGHYKLEVCGGLNEKGDKGQASCSGSAVCLEGASQTRDGSFGDSNQGMMEKSSTYLKLSFTQGRQCANGKQKAKSTIYFRCDRTAGKGIPQVADEGNDCSVTFEWKTSLVCTPEKKECLIADKGSLVDFSLLSQNTGNWKYTDKGGNLYWLNLCQSVHADAVSSGCPTNAAVCRKTKAGVVGMLGSLDSQQLSVIDPTPSKAKILIEYSEGDADVCGSSRRRRSNTSPKVEITLACSSTVGAPVLTEVKDACTFVFTWKSKLACPVGLGMDTLYKPIDVANGIVHDWRTDNFIDLNTLLSRRYNVEVEVDNKKYLINIGHEVKLDEQTTETSHCHGAAVCQINTATNSYRNIGSYNTGSFYMEDDQLEIVFTSPEKCSGKRNNVNVTTTITFVCSPGETKAVPRFLYQSDECVYLFNWDTETVCQMTKLSIAKPGTDDSDGSTKSLSGNTPVSGSTSAGRGTSKIVAGVSITIVVIVACVIALLLYSPRRRAAMGSSIKRFVLCRKGQDAPITYSRLSQAEGELDMDDEDPFNPFNEPDEEREINTNRIAPSVQTFHDDSDEDMLL